MRNWAYKDSSLAMRRFPGQHMQLTNNICGGRACYLKLAWSVGDVQLQPKGHGKPSPTAVFTCLLPQDLRTSP